jgi:hypothetical protein
MEKWSEEIAITDRDTLVIGRIATKLEESLV